MEYSKEELKELERELESYKITKNFDGKDYTFYDEDRFYKDNGALSKTGAIVIDDYNSYKGEITYKRPIKYIELREKMEQLNKLQGKREYAQKMHDKEIEENLKSLEENMQVVNETKVDEF